MGAAELLERAAHGVVMVEGLNVDVPLLLVEDVLDWPMPVRRLAECISFSVENQRGDSVGRCFHVSRFTRSSRTVCRLRS